MDEEICPECGEEMEIVNVVKARVTLFTATDGSEAMSQDGAEPQEGEEKWSCPGCGRRFPL